MDTEKTVLGVYLIILGFLMIVFQKQVSLWIDDVYGHIRPTIPTGKTRTVIIIVFGGISILIGVALLLVALAPE